MCPYAQSSFAHQDHVVDTGPANEHAEVSPSGSLPADSNVDVEGADYDLDYESGYDYTAYENNEVDADPDDTAELNADDDSNYDDSNYDDSEYDYENYDYSDNHSDYDSTDHESDNVDASTETNPDLTADDSAYDYEGYDYENYDYSNDDAGTTEANAEGETGATDNDSSDSDDMDTEYDYSEYEDFYQAETTDTEATATGGEVPANESIPAGSDDFEGDNYDYEDYFTEVNGTAEESTGAESADLPETDASVISNEDVEAFNYFDTDAYGPSAPGEDPSHGEADPNENYDGYDYEADVDLFEIIEEAQADDIATVKNEAAEVEAEVTADADDSANSLYDLRTTYDEAYDAVMTPKTVTPVADDFGGSWRDHCFGGYSVPYTADYRCDLADQYHSDGYQSFFHDGTDPSAVEVESDVSIEAKGDEHADEDNQASDVAVMPALRTMVEPYVAIVMDRVTSSWQQFSPDALVSKAAKELARLPRVFAAGKRKEKEKMSIADYIDCHIDAPVDEVNSCEIDCLTPATSTQPVGSGLEESNNSETVPDGLETDGAENADPIAEAKASFRDLRSRMNAARQSPPLR
jgi:hypothetical protein